MHTFRGLIISALFLLPLCAAAADPEPWHVGLVRAASAPPPDLSTRVVVAVLDSGIHAGAPALARTRIHRGWDFVEADDDPADDNGHGTHVASLIAGEVSPNGPLCPECDLLPVKVLDHRGLGTVQTLADGIRHAADAGADVINLSMGFDPGYVPGPALAQAVAHARSKGLVIVSSVGNEGRAGSTYPAAYAGVIGVAAVDFDGVRAPYSNVTSAVDVAAPGGDDRDRDGDGVPESILSEGLSLRAGGEAEPWLYSGTSQAAAQVTALAGRLLACGVPPDRVEALLMETARDVDPPGFDVGTGAGIVDYHAALSRCGAQHPKPWSERYRYEMRRLGGGRLEVLLRSAEGRPLPGSVLFAHWMGARSLVVAEADMAGRIVLEAERGTEEGLRVDRISEAASTRAAPSFLTPELKPYQGVLASPLSRYREESSTLGGARLRSVPAP